MDDTSIFLDTTRTQSRRGAIESNTTVAWTIGQGYHRAF